MIRAGLFFGHGTSNAHDEAAWLVLYVLGAPLDGCFKDWERILDAGQREQVRQLLKHRISQRCPLAYLTGQARFCGLDFIVTPAALVPRSPLAELIRQQFSPWLGRRGQRGRALDMCTGGACIAIAMAVHIPFEQVDAVDISAEALAVAAQNISLHGLGERVRLLQSDLFGSMADEPPDDGRYELIVSNPPYVPADALADLPAEYHAEPSLGLLSGRDGLDVVLKILVGAPAKLTAHGILVVEVGESAPALAELLPAVPFLWLEFRHGGDGVFLLEYEQLIACQADVHAVVEQREHV